MASCFPNKEIGAFHCIVFLPSHIISVVILYFVDVEMKKTKGFLKNKITCSSVVGFEMHTEVSTVVG